MQFTKIGRIVGLLVIVFVTSVAGGANVARASVPVKNVSICIDDICFPVPVTGDYFVRVADFNSDGKLDLYVTGHPTRRFVSDFLLYQNHPQSYSLNALPAQADIERARSAPISPITVSRMELNADRFYDFYLRNVDEAIADASDIIVTLARGAGGTPTHVVPVTDQFADLVEGFTGVLTAAEGWLASAERYVCPPNPPFHIYLPASWSNVLFPGTTYGYIGPPWRPFFSSIDAEDPTLDLVGGAYFINFAPTPGPCIRGIAFMKAPYSTFITRALKPSIGADVSNGADVWSQPWCSAVFGRYGKPCQSRYIFSNTGVVAGGFVLGTAIIVAVLYQTNAVSADQLLDLVEAIESAANEGWFGSLPIPPNANPANQADVGPGTSAVPLTGVDKYAFQSNCDHGPSNAPANRGASAAGSSDNLRNKLKGVGCGCPDGSDAHHILPKSDGNSFPAGLRNRIRSCLDQAGLDVDHPANGVCLPQKKDPNSKAVVHGSANGKSYWNSVAQLCENALENNGPGGVRDMLNQARENLLNGNQWWKPGGGPFYPTP